MKPLFFSFILILLSILQVAVGNSLPGQVNSGNYQMILKEKSSWLSNNEDLEKINEKYFTDGYVKINPEDFFEVSLQTMPKALDKLNQHAIVELTENQAEYFTSKHFSFEKGKKPYLVRAAFSNFTGNYIVEWNKNEKVLMITHVSLGKNNVPVWGLPLVLNLEEKPRKIFNYIQISM